MYNKDDSFYTEKNIYERSEKESINLSSRNSFEDLEASFNSQMDFEEDRKSRKSYAEVNSSLDFQK